MARFVNIDIVAPEPYEVQVGGRVFDLASTDLTGTAKMSRVIQDSVAEAASGELDGDAIVRQVALLDTEIEAMAALLGRDTEGVECTADWLRENLTQAKMAALMEACVEFLLFGGDPDPKAGGGGEPTA